MNMSDADERQLAELRARWHRALAADDAERLAEIEDEAAQITGLHLLRTVLGAVVLDPTGTDPQP